MGEAALKRFETPDETRELEHGRLDIVHLAGSTATHVTFEPGWRWPGGSGTADLRGRRSGRIWFAGDFDSRWRFCLRAARGSVRLDESRQRTGMQMRCGLRCSEVV